MLRLAAEQLKQTQIVIDRAAAIQGQIIPAVGRVEDVLNSYDSVKSRISSLLTDMSRAIELAQRWSSTSRDVNVTVAGTRSAYHYSEVARDAEAVTTTNSGLAITAAQNASRDSASTAADRVKTTADRTQTALDRIQTGSDRDTTTSEANRAKSEADRAATSATFISTNYPEVRQPKIVNPVNGGAASLSAGSLLLAVNRITSLYGELQKTIRFQIATNNTFNSGAIVYDSGVVQQSSHSFQVANAQSKFVAGTTYYVRAIQTDANDNQSVWSPTTTFIFPRLPNAPTMSAPADNATNVGSQNSAVTLTASAYSHIAGVTQASRKFELSKDNFTTIITVNGTAGQASATIASPRDVLTANTAWKVRCVDTDTNGGSATSAPTTFTTTTQYRTVPGEPDSGGFKAYNDYGDGLLWDLIIAAKSTEITRTWNGTETSIRGAFSRLNGPINTDIASTGGTSGNSAQLYAKSVSIGGVAGYLPAIDEARAISSKLKPSVATVAAFQSGGSEVFQDSNWWSSTELNSSTAYSTNFSTGLHSDSPKTGVYLVRPIKRVAAVMPYAIGTPMEGGYLAAYFTDLSSGAPVTYMLIVADKATEVTKVWRSANQTENTTSRTNGAANTNTIWNNTQADNNASTYCYNLVSGGKDDWYLGAIDEMLAIARTNSSLPSAQQLTTANNIYWSSTELDSSNARYMQLNVPTEGATAKTGTQWVRPIRRVPLAA